jgi:hypothetical protein
MKKIFLIMMSISVSLMADFTRNDTTQIVRDSKTTLQWQDDVNVSKTWEEAIEYCEALTLGSYSNWRLPNINELASIVDRSKSHPAMNGTFIHKKSSSYWSSTTTADTTSDVAWHISFIDGSQYNGNNKYYYYYVRCVRAGQ